MSVGKRSDCCGKLFAFGDHRNNRLPLVQCDVEFVGVEYLGIPDFEFVSAHVRRGGGRNGRPRPQNGDEKADRYHQSTVKIHPEDLQSQVLNFTQFSQKMIYNFCKNVYNVNE